MRRLFVALLAVCLATASARAQAVETPEPFDSAGRVMVVTPGLAADLQLRPPAWRIAGDYVGARLYRLGDSSFVIAVERRTGTVERYAITASDREYLRARTRDLPPGFGEQVAERVTETAKQTAAQVRTVFTEPGVRNAFIRNQTLLGLGVYGPSFAYSVTNENAGRAATWLLVAGGSYFGSATLTREMAITEAQNRMATDAALRGALGGWGLAYGLDAARDGQAASIFLGGIGGTAAGLYFGRRASPSQVEAGAFASTVAALTGGTVAAVIADPASGSRFPRGVALSAVGAGVLGYPIGLAYPRMVRYNVTAGDVTTLWAAGALGAMTAGTVIADHDPRPSVVATTLTAGFLGGVFLGDRVLVRRFDHTRSEGAMVDLGAAAGALMGAGVDVLVDRDGRSGALALTLATAGGVGGIFATEYFLATKADAGRLASRLRFSPGGLALAAARTPGRHAILTLAF